MNKDLKQAIKIITGILIVPFGIAASKAWPWWQKQNIGIKVVSGLFILPFILVAAPLSSWWDNF